MSLEFCPTCGSRREITTLATVPRTVVRITCEKCQTSYVEHGLDDQPAPGEQAEKMKPLKPTEIRKRLLIAFEDLEKANEKSLSRAAVALRTLEVNFELTPTGAITAEMIAVVREALGVGKIGEAQRLIAELVPLADDTGGRARQKNEGDVL